MRLTKQERKRRDDLFKQGLKYCPKCGEVKPLDAFSIRGASRDGLAYQCKECIAVRDHKYRATHKGELNAYRRKYNAAHKEKDKQYYAANKDERKEYLAANKGKISARSREYYAANKDERAVYQREYNAAHKEKIAVWKHEYRRTPKGRALHRASNHRRRAYPGGQGLTDEMMLAVEEVSNGICPYCGLPIGDDGQPDHIQPLSKGGSNELDNLVLVCAHCNLSKGAKSLDEYMVCLFQSLC